jgi:hypothetical protein
MGSNKGATTLSITVLSAVMLSVVAPNQVVDGTAYHGVKLVCFYLNVLWASLMLISRVYSFGSIYYQKLRS